MLEHQSLAGMADLLELDDVDNIHFLKHLDDMKFLNWKLEMPYRNSSVGIRRGVLSRSSSSKYRVQARE